MTARIRAVLVGLTASGKKTVGIRLALRMGAEIISLDSMKVYRGMDIGTAKPGPEERKQVPFHLLDLLEPCETFSAGRFLDESARAVESIEARGLRPLFLGGTALYLNVLLKGLVPDAGPDPALREELLDRAAREGPLALHRELSKQDPEAAEKLHPNDVKRVVRALELIRSRGMTLSRIHEERTRRVLDGPFKIAGLRRSWDDMEARIAVRTKRMLKNGLLEEVQRILDGPGFGPETGRAIGYREVLDFLAGSCTIGEAEQRINTATRRLAKKQWTWFKRFDEIRWFDLAPETDPDEVVARMLHYFDEGD